MVATETETGTGTGVVIIIDVVDEDSVGGCSAERSVAQVVVVEIRIVYCIVNLQRDDNRS